jgi:hypothetical protein
MDLTFPEEDFVCAYNKTTKKKAYCQAPELVQKVYCSMAEKCLDSELRKMRMKEKGICGIFDMCSLLKPMTSEEREEAFNEYKPRYNSCVLNAYVLQKKYGGRIVFGSQGYVKKSGGIWWEFGNPKWTKVSEFRKF